MCDYRGCRKESFQPLRTGRRFRHELQQELLTLFGEPTSFVQTAQHLKRSLRRGPVAILCLPILSDFLFAIGNHKLIDAKLVQVFAGSVNTDEFEQYI